MSEEGHRPPWVDKLLSDPTIAVDDAKRSIRDVATHIVPKEIFIGQVVRRKVRVGGQREQGVMAISPPEGLPFSAMLARNWAEGIHSFPRDTWDGDALYFWLDAAFYDPDPRVILSSTATGHTLLDMRQRLDTACDALKDRMGVNCLDRFLFIPPIEFRGKAPTRCAVVILTIDRKSLLRAREAGSDLYIRLAHFLYRERQEALDELSMVNSASRLDQRR